MKKNYVLDANVLLHDPHAIFKFEDNALIIPIFAIEEIDKFKREGSERGRNARTIARLLSPLVAGSLERAANLAEAMEARGFGAGVPTRAPGPAWAAADYAALAVGAALVLAAVLWL